MAPDDVHSRIHLANAVRRGGNTTPAAVDAERSLGAAFACDQRLAVYGTLAPGEANHHRLASCAGTWTPGTVTGRRALRTFPVFSFDPGAGPVAVHVLHSRSLPAFWPGLDEFEGDDYRRILVPVTVGDGTVVVANLYEAKLPV